MVSLVFQNPPVIPNVRIGVSLEVLFDLSPQEAFLDPLTPILKRYLEDWKTRVYLGIVCDQSSGSSLKNPNSPFEFSTNVTY